MGNHPNIWLIMLGYGSVGFFLAALVAGVLAMFGSRIIHPSVRKYILGGFLVSLGGIVLAAFNQGLMPGEVQEQVNRAIQAEARQEASEIIQDEIRKSAIYIHISNETQRDSAELFRNILRREGFVVPEIENTGRNSPNDLQVRYFPRQELQAEDVSRLLRENDYGVPALNLLSGRDSGALEVWFPLRS